MNVRRAVNIEDLRGIARRRLPRLAFDYLDGGVEDEACLNRNRKAFEQYRLLPRYLVDISTRDQSATLFGRTYSSPFGIAPTGLNAFIHRGGDELLAAAAAAANIPFVLSGSSNASIEAIAKIAPQHAWVQLYAARDPKITHDLIRRTRDAVVETLVVTVDVPVRPKRERDIRNGFGARPKLSPRLLIDMLLHPAWLAVIARHGIPRFDSWASYLGPEARALDVAAFLSSQFPAPQTWQDLETYRRLWPGKLVVKGILHPDDARRAAQAGADGVIVSNHGGRQLDSAPSPIEAFPAISDAVRDQLVLMLDSGVRRGADVLKALALGARFVFVGRAALYGVAAGGLVGAKKAIAILREEIDLVMAQIGCRHLADLDGSLLASKKPED
jgi:L-lactate dehydrogenase (cytochrome)/(S)-mandelate dehydrogenase